VSAVADELRLPPLGDVERELTRLRQAGLVMRPKAGGFAITPEGELAIVAVVGELTSTGPSTAVEGSQLGSARHQIIPAELAPETWIPAIARLLEKHPFETNVFLMSRFPDREDDPLMGVIREARQSCAEHGLTLHVAGDQNADPLLFNNVAGYMWACRFGLALFEAHGDPPKKPATLNQNLLIEVGGMLISGRRCAILRDESVERMPTDLVGHIFHPLVMSNSASVKAVLHEAIVRDFGVPRCPGCAPALGPTPA
jgi:hypothetical protein